MKLFTAGLIAGTVASSFLACVFSAHAATETVLHTFQGGANDGAYPLSGLIELNGTLYGMTGGGGNGCGGGCGTVYSLNPKTGAETILHNFTGGTDGYAPQYDLINVGGVLYGITRVGGGTGCGGDGCGTVFSLDLTTGVEAVLYSFCSQTNCEDGASPSGTLSYVNGILYGTTENGAGSGCGGGGCGTIFSLDITTAKETVLYAFCSQTNCTDGTYPGGNLLDENGTLYGAAGSGGTGDAGTLFSFNLSSGAETTLYSFCSQNDCSDGWGPNGLYFIDGSLYGTTSEGGGGGGNGCYSYGCGTAFSLDLKTNAYTVLYTFHHNCKTGCQPDASFVALGKRLLSTAPNGGLHSEGTVFSVERSSGHAGVLHSFTGSPDGATPYVDVLKVKGTIFGTTEFGGTRTCSSGCGTVFAITP